MRILIPSTLSLVLLLTACDQKKGPHEMEMPAVPVLAIQPAVQDVPENLESIGTLKPLALVEIRPQVNGMVIEVMVREGQPVQQGAPLFKIDPRSYEIKVQEAEALLAMDRASLDAAQKKMSRYESLVQKDIVAKTEWDDLETQLAKAKAAVDADQARLNAAQLDLERCTISSPVEGRMGKLDVHPGQLVVSSQPIPLTTIEQMHPLIVEFSLTEKEFAALPKKRLEIEIQPLSSGDGNAKGVVTFLDNHFDARTGQLLVRGKVANPHYALRPGQSVRVRIPVAVTHNAILIPQKAVKFNQQGSYVYVVLSDQTVGLRQITLGKNHGNEVMVQEGLDPIEPVITDGHLRLSPGTKVKIQS